MAMLCPGRIKSAITIASPISPFSVVFAGISTFSVATVLEV
jgi:hypothetical protein